jgi:hypothetical protein
MIIGDLFTPFAIGLTDYHRLKRDRLEFVIHRMAGKTVIGERSIVVRACEERSDKRQQFDREVRMPLLRRHGFVSCTSCSNTWCAAEAGLPADQSWEL